MAAMYGPTYYKCGEVKLQFGILSSCDIKRQDIYLRLCYSQIQQMKIMKKNTSTSLTQRFLSRSNVLKVIRRFRYSNSNFGQGHTCTCIYKQCTSYMTPIYRGSDNGQEFILIVVCFNVCHCLGRGWCSTSRTGVVAQIAHRRRPTGGPPADMPTAHRQTDGGVTG